MQLKKIHSHRCQLMNNNNKVVGDEYVGNKDSSNDDQVRYSNDCVWAYLDKRTLRGHQNLE